MARPGGAQALRASRQKLYPDPVMGRGYLNVRATGGAVEPLPWRGLRGWGEEGLGRRSKPSWLRGLGDRKNNY